MTTGATQSRTSSQPEESKIFREGHNGVPMGSQDSGIDEQSTTDSTPEDVAALYAWANLRGAKYRDYSASRREHRAHVRYRAAKTLLERELKAQAEAEASAEAAEREAREAEARALAGSATEPQKSRFAALHAAEAAALKAAADRVEAAQRSEAAAHVTVVALREQRELAEAQASAAHQAMIYTEADVLRKQLAGPQPRLPFGVAQAAPELAPEGVPTDEPVSADALKFLEQETPAALPAPARSGWTPLSEAILGPEQDWNTRAKVWTPAQNEATGERARPAWLAIPDAHPAPEILSNAPSPGAEAAAIPDDSPDTATDVSAHIDIDAPSNTPTDLPQAAEALPRWLALREVAESSERQSSSSLLDSATEIRTPLLAVFSMAGGMGATSLSAALARALSAAGEKVLLVDTTSQALLPFYFGGKELRPGLMRTYSPPQGSGEPISLILHDATQMNGDEGAQQRLTRQIFASGIGSERMLVDVSPASSWLLRRWAELRPAVLVPLVPSMDSVIRLESTEKLFRSIPVRNGRPFSPYYVLNHFDASLPLHVDVRTVLRRRLGDRLLRFTIRNAPSVAEALADGMTVLDYKPRAEVAQAYREIAAWLRSVSPPREIANGHWGEP